MPAPESPACDETEEVVIVVGGGGESLGTVWSRVGGSSGTWCCSQLTGLALPTSSTGTDGGDMLAGFAVALNFLGFADVDALAAWYASASPEQREAVLETINIIMLAHQPETE